MCEKKNKTLENTIDFENDMARLTRYGKRRTTRRRRHGLGSFVRNVASRVRSAAPAAIALGRRAQGAARTARQMAQQIAPAVGMIHPGAAAQIARVANMAERAGFGRRRRHRRHGVFGNIAGQLASGLIPF